VADVDFALEVNPLQLSVVRGSSLVEDKDTCVWAHKRAEMMMAVLGLLFRSLGSWEASA